MVLFLTIVVFGIILINYCWRLFQVGNWKKIGQILFAVKKKRLSHFKREITRVIVSWLNVFAISNSSFDAITFFPFFFYAGIFDVQHPLCIQILLPPVYWRYSRA